MYEEGKDFQRLRASRTLPARVGSTPVKRPLRVAELVARIIQYTTAPNSRGSMRASGRRTLEVFQAFDAIGPPLTDHAQPSSFRKGRLTLRVNSSAWLTELSMMHGQIVERLNARLDKPWVEEVRLIMGSPQPRRGASSSPQRAPALNPVQQEKVSAWSSSLADDRVRAAFEKAATRSLAEGPSGPPPLVGPPGPRVMPPTDHDEPDPLEAELSYGYGERKIDRWKLRYRPRNN